MNQFAPMLFIKCIACRRWSPASPGLWLGAIIVLTIVLAPAAQADVSDYTYITNGLEITITGYSDFYGDEIGVIPDTIDGLPVTSIGDSAFDLEGMNLTFDLAFSLMPLQQSTT